MIVQGQSSYRLSRAILSVCAIVILLVCPRFGETEDSKERDREADALVEIKPAPLGMPQISFAGTCLDEKGIAVASADVRLFAVMRTSGSIGKEHRLIARVAADQEGRFDLGEFASPSSVPSLLMYLVVATKDGFATGITPRFPGPVGTEGLKVVLAPSGALTGRVTNVKGKPVVNAVVLAPYGWPGGFRATKTDGNGRYALRNLPRWNSEIIEGRDGPFPRSRAGFTVSHPRYGTMQSWYAACPGTADVQFERPVVIEGQVVNDKSGKAASGIQVWIQSTRDGIRRDPRHRRGGGTATTDDEGRYRVALQGLRQINIGVDSDRFVATAVEGLDVEPGRIKAARTMRLVTGGVFSVRIVDADTMKTVPLPKGDSIRLMVHGPGHPTSSASVYGTPMDADGTVKLRVAPGINYPYFSTNELSGLRSKWVILDNYPNPSNYRDNPVDIRDGQTVNLTLRMRRRRAE